MTTQVLKRSPLKTLLACLLFGAMGSFALLSNLACNTTTPSSPNNLQSPLQTIAAINPTWSLTPTSTYTFTSTITFTPTNTGTPTPYIANTPWVGFSGPQAVAYYNNNPNGGLFIADTGHNQVKKYSTNGTRLTTWGDKGIVLVNAPSAVAVDGGGNLYVVGGITGVNRYDGSGNLTNQFNSVAFTNPKGVAVDGSGNIYVSDTTNQAIVKLNAAGVSVASLPLTAVGGVTLASPYGIAVDHNNNVAVAASDNNIHYFSSISPVVLVTTIPGYPVTPSAFNFSTGVSMGGLAFDSSNDLFVADTGYHQVEEFANYALNQSPINIFNGSGTLNAPTGVAVDGNGNVFVTDTVNNNVVMFLP